MCKTRFDAFAERAFRILEPGIKYEWNWHIGCIAEHLEANLEGELPWLIINLPPRQLKSTLVAQLWPPFVLGRQPHHQFIGASYAASLSERNVVNARKVMNDSWYREVFPEAQLDIERQDYFTTKKNGQYKGTGIGGTVTGFGCNTLILDDPINPKEAASDTIRNHTNEEIRSTLFSRFNDRRDAHFVGIMQRTHEDDPTGNLARDQRYYVLKLPAEAKKRIYIPALKAGHDWCMEAGELLTERLTQKDLAELRDDLGEYNYVGQYLQEPVPVGGGEFKSRWLQHYQDGGVKPKTMNICILGDPSAGDENNKKKKKLSDFTAFMVVGLAPDNNYYLLDIVRDRLNPTERVETLFMLHRKWNALAGKPPRVGYEKYGMMSDNHYIKAKMKEDGYNFHMVELGGRVDKESRIRRLIPDMEGGRWYFPANLQYVDNEGRSFDLVRELEMSEMPTFPKARFDDMLDALSRVYDEDMMMTFPRPKQTEKQKMLSSAFKDESGVDWMDF
ncbi:unnamed protein product [Sphagnum balticum]